MARFSKTPFGELEKGFKVKHPPKGGRIGTVLDVQRKKKDKRTTILVRWDDDNSVSSASEPDNYEIMAKEET